MVVPQGCGIIVGSSGDVPATLTVSGTLSPDVTGEYVRDGDWDGYPRWRKPTTNFVLIYWPAGGSYVLTGNQAGPDNGPTWGKLPPFLTSVKGGYEAGFACTGDATVV